MQDAFPSEFDPLLTKFANASENVQLMWRYAIAVWLINDEKAHIVGIHQDEETLHIVAQTLAGERFEIVRPPMSEQTEQELLEQVMRIVAAGG